MSDEVDPKHYYYVGANNLEWEQRKAKLGHTEDSYNRKSGYAPAYQSDDPFRFRLIIEVYKPNPKSGIEEIEKTWIAKFPQIEKLKEDEGKLNVASSTEAVRFTDHSEFKTVFQKVLADKGLSGLFIRVYTTPSEIEGLLHIHKVKYHSVAPLEKSLCGIKLRPYQEEDINVTLNAFVIEKIPRAYWSIMCGLGKTLMTYELILRIKSQSTLFVVSRNVLLEQALTDFMEYGCSIENLFMYSANKMPSHLQDIKKIRSFTDLPSDKPWICVVHYGNLSYLKGANVNLIVFDEAHHLVPSAKKDEMLKPNASSGDLSGNQFGLSDANIKAKWRLALTATPKDTPCVENNQISRIGFTFLPDLFGPCLTQRNYVFGKENEFLAPFEVVSIRAEGNKIREMIESLRKDLHLPSGTFKDFLEQFGEWATGKRTKLKATKFIKQNEEDEEEEEVDDDEEESENAITPELTLWYAVVSILLLEIIRRDDRKRIVTCHNTTKKARLFKRIFNGIWLMKNKTNNTSITCEAVHSQQKNAENQEIKKRFKAKDGADIRILCNIRTLMEGFDEPSIDTILFVDNKWSPIECIQFIGRGLRLDPNNKEKVTKVLIPFITQEIIQDEDLTILRTTSDYANVRYCIKHIIESLDPNQVITGTVWVPKPNDSIQDVDKKLEDEVDPTERIYIPNEFMDQHDKDLLGVCPTSELAGKSFTEARIWMHELVRREGWGRFNTEQESRHAWDRYRNTHTLPKGIPYDPAKVYKEVGYINWRDYAGVLLTPSDIQELSAGEMITLISIGLNPINHTMTSLRKEITKMSSRRLPDNPRQKWKLSIYDLMEKVKPGSTEAIRIWGKRTDKLYIALQTISVRNIIVFESKWTEIHSKDLSIPGLPTEIFGLSFWDNYEPAL